MINAIIIVMKTIVEINVNNYASTGKIVLHIATVAREKGYKVYTCCRRSRAGLKYAYLDQIYIGTWLDRVISERLAYIFGLNGCFNAINTWLFIRKLKKLKPDLIHLHSMCDSYLNIRMLFRFLKNYDVPVVWTMHDNWAFTGRCAQFRCEKWKEGCGNCPHLEYYPASLFLDNTASIWKQREKLYNALDKLTIVTPSAWLAELVKESLFNKNHPIRVINNGIDLNAVHPIESDFRKQYHLEERYIILAVAYYWDEGKGLNVLQELARRLPEKYQIVMVGTSDEVDRLLPKNIISIHRTYNQEELVKIYSAADLFVNPTTDENFPTVNMEALACGLPVLTYATGGSAEIIDGRSGASVPPKDIDMLEKEILRICEEKPYTKENCLARARQFDMNDKFNEYVDLYDELLD